MKLLFLGTNGWYSTKTGNTVCAVLFAKDRLISLDAGDGFYKVCDLVRKRNVKKVDVFLSHLHFDHVVGFHSLPKIPKGTKVRIFIDNGYVGSLSLLLNHPFTAGREDLKAKVEIVPLKVGRNKTPYTVHALPLLHVDPCLGFRFEIGGRKIAYCTDTGPCKNILKLGNDVDLLVTECSLLPGADLQKSWPHLSPEMAARIAKQSRAKMLILDHFDANKYKDIDLRKGALKAAKKIFRNTRAARDGLVISV